MVLDRIAWYPEMSVGREVQSGQTNSAEKIMLPIGVVGTLFRRNPRPTILEGTIRNVSVYLKEARQIAHLQLPCALWRFQGRRIRILQMLVALVAPSSVSREVFSLGVVHVMVDVITVPKSRSRMLRRSSS